MITTVLFDMGGTLEDVYVDDVSQRKALGCLREMLLSYGLNPAMDDASFQAQVDEGWVRYGAFRDARDVELKPVEIWCDYVLADFGFPREILAPHCEQIAHMWEVTHYHRSLRPGVEEMLQGLKSLGLKLGIISNTAAMYQVFDILDEYGIRSYFQDVTLSSVTGLRKPCTDIFSVALHQVCSAPEECVYVGDTISRDVIGSKSSGFAVAIQICSQLTREKDAGVRHAYEPDYTVENIYDVYPIVRKLVKNA